MRHFFTLIVLCFATINLGACVINDVVDGVVQATESPEKRSARLKRERVARERQAEYRRQQAVDRQKREEEKIAAIVNSFRATCSSYGYATGTPDFNQCVGNELKAYEQKQTLLAMDRAASKRAADQRARDEAERRREISAEIDAANEQRRRDVNDFFGMPNY
jgi:hypothetical protein